MTTGAGLVVAGAGAAALVVAGGVGFALEGDADGVTLALALGDAGSVGACTAIRATCATGAVDAFAFDAVAAMPPMMAPVTAVHDAAVTAILCLCADMDSGMDRRSLGTKSLPSAGGHGEAAAAQAAL